MPSPSRRTTSAALQCVFRPTMPYTTWTPARSSMRAHVMLFCSSLRALSSTSAVTCLPFCAARASAEMIGLAPLVRYSVCLMARTCGSSAARSMKSTTHPNDSYGKCTSTSCERITSNTSRPCAKGGATRGTSGSSFSAGKSSRWRAMRAVTSTGPGTRYTSRASRSCASVSIPTKVSSPSAEISSRTGSLRRRCRRLSSIISSRSSASSSSIVRSVFRVPRDDGERCEDGSDAGAEQGVHVPPLGGGQVVEPHALHAAPREAGKDLVVQDAILLGDELVGATVDRRQLLGRGHPVRPVVLRLYPRVRLLLQPRHADLEELVQ